MMIKMEIKQFQLSACAFGLSVISPPVDASQSSPEKHCYRAACVPAFDLIFEHAMSAIKLMLTGFPGIPLNRAFNV